MDLLRKDQLYNYQLWLARTIKRMKRVLLAVDMAMGKTISCLTVIKRLHIEFQVRRTLIVAPVRVAQITWPDEIAKWEHTRDIEYVVLKGTPAQRAKLLDKKGVEVYIINRELLPWLWAEMAKRNWTFDAVFYDESSRLKSGKKRTAAKRDASTGKKKRGNMSEFGALCHLTVDAEYVVLMSGTIAPNGLEDLWAQAYILDRGERLYPDKKTFMDRWFYSKDYMGWDLQPHSHSFDEVMGLLDDIMIGLRAEDYIELPPIQENNVWVELSASAMKQYKRFERTLVAEEYDIEAVNRGVLQNKLMQFANGSMYRRDEETDEVEDVYIHDEKIKALEDIVYNTRGENLLVAYAYKFDKTAIRKKFPKAVFIEDDPQWKDRWDRGEIAMLVAHAQSIGHGMNMQKGGHHVVWFGVPWSLENYQQFNQRLPRLGQASQYVYVHRILARGTVDEDVSAGLVLKGGTQQDITDRVRRRLDDIRKDLAQ